MMFYKKKIFIFSLLILTALPLAVIILFSVHNSPVNTVSAAETCVLKSVSWSKTEAIVAERVYISVIGENCNDWGVSLSFWTRMKVGQFSDQFIKTINEKFPADKSILATSVVFTGADYIKAGDSSDREFVYIKATAGSSTVTSASVSGERIFLKLRQPVAGSCQLSSAKWKQNFCSSPIEGSPMYMTVTGIGCSTDNVGHNVKLEVYEDDTGYDDTNIVTLFAKFNSDGTKAETSWTVEGKSDDDKIGSYEFYFKALAGNSIINKSDTLLIPLKSYSGCVNCNANIPPTECKCNDGYSVKRDFAGTCENVCKSHIGDALTNTCGGKSGGDGDGDDGGIGTISSKSKTVNIDFNPPSNIKEFKDLIKEILKWLTTLVAPIAVIAIIWGGFLMMSSGGTPERFKKGGKILWYAIIGLAIILIGRGFVTLIKSIIDLRNK